MDTLFPLAPFEQYMLQDDRAEYPMVFFLRLKFHGLLDQATFKNSLDRVAGRHPLLQSVVRTVDGVACWTPAEDPTPFLSWESSDKPIDRAAAGPNDLTQRTGLRAWVRTSAANTSVLLEFHHTCCDGIAAMQFIEDLLTAYNNEVAARNPATARENSRPMRPLAPSKLRDRAGFGLTLVKKILRAPLGVSAAVGLGQFFVNRPAAVAVPAMQLNTEPPENGLACVSHRFGRAQLDQLREIAHRLGVTVNDLMVRDLLSTVEQWNRRNDPKSGACVRVSVPVNLRLKSDDQLPAANVVSMVFVDRKPRSFRSPLRMLRSIRRDTWIIKKFRMGLVFNSVLALLARFQGALASMLITNRCMASAVLSNLGPQLDLAPLPRQRGRIDLGDATLDEIEFMPPIRPFTRMALGVVTYGGDLTVSVQYDANCLTSASATNFLANYAATLTSTATGHRDQLAAPTFAPRPVRGWNLRGFRPSAAQTAAAMVSRYAEI